MEHLKAFLCIFILTTLVIHTAEAVDEFPFMLPYGRVLERFVDPNGFVDYRGLKAKPADLEDFMKALDSLEPQTYESFADQGKVAFWLNVYNVLTLKVIIDHYPIQSSPFKSLRYPKNSIRQISGVWDKITFSVLRENLSLDQIEHEILRKKFKEPRIHMALVCAARGCPALRREPYTGEKLDVQLDDQTQKFLSDSQKFFIDTNKRIVYLSSIFKWFGEDFLNRYSPETGFEGHSQQEKAVLFFISLHIPEKQRNFLMRSEYKIKYIKYDWALNERVIK
jgi:hypothetical protein